MARFILASASPRRKELLQKAGYTFEIVVSDADESLPAGFTPEKAVQLFQKSAQRRVIKHIIQDDPSRFIIAPGGAE